jgi:hypothetical protein
LLFHAPTDINISYRNMTSGKSAHLPFLFANPELMERPKAGEDGSTKPAPVAPLKWVPRGVDLGASKMAHELVVKAFGEARKEASATRHNDVAEQLLSQVGIACV